MRRFKDCITPLDRRLYCWSHMTYTVSFMFLSPMARITLIFPCTPPGPLKFDSVFSRIFLVTHGVLSSTTVIFEPLSILIE